MIGVTIIVINYDLQTPCSMAEYTCAHKDYRPCNIMEGIFYSLI